MDDFSLQVIEGQPLSIATSLDEYYVGEIIPWSVGVASTNGDITISLLTGDPLVAEQTHKSTADPLRGEFESANLRPGIYTLQARSQKDTKEPQTAQKQIMLTRSPWGE